MFTCLECAPNFDGNPEGALHVTLGDIGYNPAMMPVLIGLHGAYYTVLFRPGEYNVYLLCPPILRLILLMFAGVDYNAREMYNMHLDNEYYAGELHEDEYCESQFPEGVLWPEGGRVAEPRVEGPGICRPRRNIVFILPSTLPMSWRPEAPGGQRRVYGARRRRRV